MTRTQTFGALSSLLLFCSIVHADDWPQFRGPDRSGVSKETGLLKTWPKAGLKLAWTFKNAGSGISSFAVVKGVIYTLGTRDKDEMVIALDEKTGSELWTAKIGPIFNFKGNKWGVGPRSTPTVEGNHLYALGGQGILVCIDISMKGKELWRKDLIKELNGEMMTEWGYSESPLIDGKLLICTPGGKDGNVAALDKMTGAVVWRTKEWTEKAPYTSAVVGDFHGVRQYIQTGYTGGNAGASIAGVEAKSGKVLWSKKIFTGDSYAIAPTPLVKDNFVYITSGMSGTGCHLFEIDSKQQATEKYSKKNQKQVKNSHGGVVLIGDSIYGHSEKERWICQDFLTGDLKWEDRDKLTCPSAAVTAAEAMLYLFTDEGDIALAKANPMAAGLELEGNFKLPERSSIPGKGVALDSKPWAYPVIANGRLLVRDHELVFSFDISAKK